MDKTSLAVLFGLGMVLVGVSGSYALQAGGVETGDLETGTVVGQPFKELTVDAAFYSIDIGNMKTWYPPTTVIDFKTRPGAPVLIKVAGVGAEVAVELVDDRAPRAGGQHPWRIRDMAAPAFGLP